MPQLISKKTFYHTADRSRIVEEGDPDAAFLIVRAGGAIEQAEAERLGISGQRAPVYDAKRDHFEKHGGVDPTLDTAGRQRMLSGEDDPDGPAALGERGNLTEGTETEADDGPDQGDVNATTISAKSWFLTEDRTRLVEEGDPDARDLFIQAGSEVDDAAVQPFGMTADQFAAANETSAKAKRGPAANKAKAPGENK